MSEDMKLDVKLKQYGQRSGSAHKFSQGDRVAVYATASGISVRSTGVVNVAEPTRLLIDLDKNNAFRMNGLIWAHPKQCRRLKKREPRQVWVLFKPTGEVEDCTSHPELVEGKWIEFVEVMK